MTARPALLARSPDAHGDVAQAVAQLAVAKEEAQKRERDEPQGDPQHGEDGPDQELPPHARPSSDDAMTIIMTMDWILPRRDPPDAHLS